ncbi:MAG: PAS domain S-box protein, partial [Hyphomicrobiales bacterium]|nr:PAS domain S-box protein [Hyphomicrobiales bacterium]
IGAPLDSLDLATVLKVSQAVSGEIVLERLLDTLMRTAVEQAGAERGLLLISHEGELRIAAEATTRDDAIAVRLGDQPVASTALPEAIVQTVARTHETVILNDAATDPTFGSDAFIRQRQTRSVLCLALVTQSKLIGVLYLENNLASGAFTPARICVLRLIASQAAISLENTRLYRDLAERESRIRRLVDANIIGVFNWRTEGEDPETSDIVASDANDAFARMVGYDRADFAAGRVRRSNLTPPEWGARTQQAHGELMTTGTSHSYEKEYIRKDGSRVPVLIGAAVFESGSQGVAFVVDLTARKQAEQELRASESRFRTFVDHATDAFFLHDNDLTTLDVNRRACVLLGYTRNELIGMNARDFGAGLDAAPIERLRRRVSAGETMTFETRFRRKDGTLFPVELQIARFEQGGERFLALARDITLRKRAEQRLLAHHAVSRILAEAATVEEASLKVLQLLCERLEWDRGVLWRVDREADALRCVEFWRANAVAAGQFEITTRAAVFQAGRGLPGHVWATRAPLYIADVALSPIYLRADAAASEGLRAAFGFPILLGGEVLGVLDFASREMAPPDPDLLDMVATIGSQVGQFIERKRAESALQLAQTDLAHVMRVMTMGELTASIAHEINQPLTALAITSDACLRWLAREPPNLEEARKCLHRMSRDSRRAADVVARIRSLVKKAPPIEVRLDLNEAIQEVLAITAPEARRQGVTVRTELSPDLPPVRGDRVQLQQVMLNLVVNGIDAMKEVTDRPREMRIRSSSPSPDSVLVAIADNGVGLTEASLEKIFKG